MKVCCFNCKYFRPYYEGEGGGNCKVDEQFIARPRLEINCVRFTPLRG